MVLKNENSATGSVFAAESVGYVNVTDSTVTLENTVAAVNKADVTISNSEVVVTSTVENGLGNAFNGGALTVNGDSRVNISKGAGIGIVGETGSVSIEDTAIVEVSEMGETCVKIYEGQTLTVEGTAMLILDEKVEGDAIIGDVHDEHDWIEATCLEVRHCSTCGATEGELAPHAYKDATCVELKTCTICGVTEGELAPHPDKNHNYTCDYCGEKLPIDGTVGVAIAAGFGVLSLTGVGILMKLGKKKRRYRF